MNGSIRIIIAVVVIAACNIICENSEKPATSPFATGQSQCEELAGSSYQPVSPGTILFVGHDPAGTYYLVDRNESSPYRCFSGDHDSLIRKNAGGYSIFDQKYYFLWLEDSVQIIFQNSADTWSNAFIVTSGGCRSCDSIFNSKIDMSRKDNAQIDSGWLAVCSYLQNELPSAIPLTIDGTSAIQGFKMVNFPAKTHVEYLAQQTEGKYLLVTSVKYDWDGQNVVLHYGTKDAMEKCNVTSFLRASDGGSTWIKFTANEKNYVAVFKVKLESTGSISYSSTYLKTGTDSIALQILSPDIENCARMGFDCPSLR